MIYEIDNKYYVKVGYEYNEIEIKLNENKDVVLVPLKNRISGEGKDIKTLVFKNEIDNFKKKLQKKETSFSNKNNITNDTKHKYNRWG